MTAVRPLRQDAARNRERLVTAARAVFRRKGLDAPLEEIAREAGVAIGTLYNRFPARGELVDAALGPLAEQAVEIAEQALRTADPWDGFAFYLEGTCALLAEDRGYADVHRARVAGTPVIDAARKRIVELKAAIDARAKAAGVLRTDVDSHDLALDGLRPGAAHPLPVPPLTRTQLRDAERPG